MAGRVIHVAVAVIENAAGAVLLSRRHADAHQGGLWEFPGGKVEAGETVEVALAREIAEELGLTVRAAEPLIRIHHDYGDRRVLLDTWRVTAFDGEPQGREGQPLRWVAPADLGGLEFPAANRPIVAAVRLPSRYLITPEPGSDRDSFLLRLDAAVEAGIELIQLRARRLDGEALARLARQALQRLDGRGARLLLNGPPELAAETGAAGVHLNSRQLHALPERPLAADRLVAASCHGPADLQRAAELGCDFVVLSPVRPTASHPDAEPLGWETFARWVEAAPLPVYALGGLAAGDLELARRHGAQGIAGIRGLWPPTRDEQ